MVPVTLTLKDVIMAVSRYILAFPLIITLSLYEQTYANTSKYEGMSLCNAGDEIYQACTTQSGKILSVCGTTGQNSGLMYLVYGTSEKILVSSPKTGEFPLKYSHMGMADYSFYFTDNGKYYIQYEASDVRGPFDQSGFIIENKPDHKVIIHDLCKSDLKTSEKYQNSNSYINRQRKIPSYNNNIDGNYYELLDIMTETADREN